MRIGIIAIPLDRQYAGIHYYVDSFVNELNSLQCEHDFIIFRDRHDANLNITQEILSRRGKSAIGFLTTVLKDIPRLAQELNLDVVIEPAHFGPFNLPKRIKRVTIIHDITPITHSQWHSKTNVWGHKIFLTRILRNADLIITNSSHTKQEVLSYSNLDSTKILSAHLGVDPIFKPTSDSALLQRYGIVKRYFLYQGTIEPRKNLVRLVKAYDEYRRSNPKITSQLILSGKKGWGYKPLLNAINQSAFHKDIIFLGYVKRKDMPILYSSAEALIYPSLYEGFGMPIIEALACGTPVLCSNTSSMPEVAGSHGIYIDPLDIEDIAKGIKEVSQLYSIGADDRIQFARKYNWNTMTKNIIEEIETLERD